MTNEVATIDVLQDLTTALNFEPAIIELMDADTMVEAAKDLALKYKGLVVTEDTKSSVSKTRAALNGYVKQLEAKRKEIKRENERPYKVFEQQVKDIEEPFQQAIAELDIGLNVLKDQKRQERRDLTTGMIQLAAQRNGLEADEIARHSEWDNLTYSGGDIQRQRDIEQAAKDAVQGKKYRMAQIKAITEYCEAKHIDASGWIQSLINYDYDTDRIERAIDESLIERKQEQLAEVVDEDTGEITKRDRTIVLEMIDYETFDSIKQILEVNDIKFREV